MLCFLCLVLGCKQKEEKEKDFFSNPQFQELDKLAILTGELIYRGEYDKFEKKQKEFLKLLEKSDKKYAKFWAIYYVNMSFYNYNKGNYQGFYHDSKKVINMESDDPDFNSLRVMSYYNLAEAYGDVGQYNMKNSSLIEALKLMEKYKFAVHIRGGVYVTLAKNYKMLHQMAIKTKKPQAGKYLDELKKYNKVALKLLFFKDKDTTAYKRKVMNYPSMAENLYYAGDKENAQKVFKDLYDYAINTSNAEVFLEALSIEVSNESKNIDVTNLSNRFHEADSIMIHKFNEQQYAFYNLLKGKYYYSIGKFKEAIQYAELVLPFYKAEDNENLKDINEFLADSYQKEGNTQKAIDYYKEFIVLDTKIKEKESVAELEKFNMLIDIYDAREQERIDFEKAKDGRRENYLIAVSLGLILVVLLLVLLIQRNAGLKTKQKLLASEIQYNKEMNEKLELENIYQLKNDLVAKKALHISNMEIAKNLHDDMASGLAALNFLIADKVKRSETEEEKKRIDTVKKEVNSLYENFRMYIHHLYSQGTKEFSLSKNFLNTVFTNTTELKTELAVDFKSIDEKLSVNQQNQLLRILNEAVTNIYKYSKSSLAKLEVNFENNNCYFKVEDNGVGFNLNSKKGIGLENMKERITHLGGELNVESALNRGTIVSGSFPIV